MYQGPGAGKELVPLQEFSGGPVGLDNREGGGKEVK